MNGRFISHVCAVAVPMLALACGSDGRPAAHPGAGGGTGTAGTGSDSGGTGTVGTGTAGTTTSGGGAKGVAGAPGSGGSTQATGPGLAITPKNGKAPVSGKLQFTAVVTGVSNSAVDWTVQEPTIGGAVSDSGLYSAPAQSGVFHVCATSKADSKLQDCAVVTVSAAAGTPPVYKSGVWSNLTPPYGGTGASVSCMAMDPSDPLTIYVGINWKGLWKTTDGGSTWKALGSGSDPNPYDKETGYLDDASAIAVDPNDSQHLYLSKGVDGDNIGFWVSRDGGESWKAPANFPPAGTTTDVTTMAVDPADFKHLLLGSHGYWANATSGGIIESLDGGESWIAHPAQAGWPAGSVGVQFLNDPAAGIGNGKTWLVVSTGFYLTKDAGANWAKISDFQGVHGAVETTRITPDHFKNDPELAKFGVLYAAGPETPVRSKDDGATWERKNDLPSSVYYTVGNDGTNLYAVPDKDSPVYTSPVTDGEHWVAMNGGAQKFARGSIMIRFDRANRIVYMVNWEAGIWGLKTDL